jgi:hypothetical protein
VIHLIKLSVGPKDVGQLAARCDVFRSKTFHAASAAAFAASRLLFSRPAVHAVALILAITVQFFLLFTPNAVLFFLFASQARGFARFVSANADVGHRAASIGNASANTGQDQSSHV